VPKRKMDMIFTEWAADRGVLNGSRLAAMHTAELNQDWKMACYAFGVDTPHIDILSTSYKSLDQPPLNTPDLTRMGLHCARHVFANYAHQKRSSWLGIAEHLKEEFDTEGLVIRENFPMPDSYIKVLMEQKEVSVHKEPFSMFTSPTKNHTFQLPGIVEMAKACIGTEHLPDFYNNVFNQVIENKEDDNDEQKDYHCDTFFPALKFWYFPEDVSVEQGPFVYVKNSPIITPAKLDWLYEQTCEVVHGTWDKKRRRGHPEGSFRVTETELFKMDLHACPVPVKAGTLILGNVGGFHGRGSVSGQHTRRAIHGSVRVNNPFQ
jgi:hypothetical protein